MESLKKKKKLTNKIRKIYIAFFNYYLWLNIEIFWLDIN